MSSEVVTINRFHGGMTNVRRPSDSSVCAVSQQFDLTNEMGVMIPLQSVETDGTGDTEGIVRILNANSKLYGLGRSSSVVKIYEKGSGLATAWAASTNGTSGGGARTTKAFVEYKNYLYGFRGTNVVWKWGDFTGAPTFTDTDLTTASSFTTTVQGLVHSKDDCLYMAYDNVIIRKNVATWTDGALTLPTNMTITGLAEYNNFLAIACKPKMWGHSRVYLWDRDASLTTLSESVDAGEGDIYAMENYEGNLIIVTGPSTTAFLSENKVFFKYYAGASGFKTFEQLDLDVSTNFSITDSKVYGNKLYFMMQATIAGNVMEGVWSVSSAAENTKLAVAFECALNNGTAVTSATLHGFFVSGPYFWLCYQNNGSYVLNRTEDTSTSYTATSVRETCVNPKMAPQHHNLEKQLESVSLSYNPLPTAGSAVLKYKVDGGAWTTIFTETTDSAVNTERMKTDSGTEFTKGRSYEFRIESTGGAEIVEFSYKYRPLKSLLN